MATPTRDWTWQDCVDAIAELGALETCEQQAEYHGEGDVGTHTRLVVESLLGDPAFDALPPDLQTETFLAALLHDVAKPACFRIEEGRITARGHARIGAIMARRILWQLGVAPETRERICTLIHYHLHPFWALEREDAHVHAMAVSLRSSCAQLEMLARADGCGRIADTADQLVEAVGLYGDWCRELGLGAGPFPFPNDEARVQYFRRHGDRDPHYAPQQTHRCEVTVMSGLPGAGKDHWIAQHCSTLPVVSLDAIRDEGRSKRTGSQGPTVALAKERAREHLRSGTDFVWNATNLSHQVRDQVVGLLYAYDARVRIVAVEASEAAIRERNRHREHAVPPAAIDKMLRRWEAPDITEAEEVVFVTS